VEKGREGKGERKRKEERSVGSPQEKCRGVMTHDFGLVHSSYVCKLDSDVGLLAERRGKE
jgi:hypothetical protein